MTLNASDNPPACFPEQLFTSPTAGKDEKIWWVARTKSRQEKALAWNLVAREVEYFLPLVSRPQKCKGRMRSSIVPLFNGYLFFRADQTARSEAMKTGKIAQVLEVKDQQGLLSELSSLARASAAKIELTLCDFVTSGQRVRILDGPFKDLEGIVKKRKNSTRLILQIEAIRQAAAVEIALDQAQPI